MDGGICDHMKGCHPLLTGQSQIAYTHSRIELQLRDEASHRLRRDVMFELQLLQSNSCVTVVSDLGSDELKLEASSIFLVYLH